MEKDCKNCYWYSQCDHAEVCEYYEPLEDDDETAVKEYEADLEQRARIYQKLVDEQDS